MSNDVEKITPRVLVRIELDETPTRSPKTRYEAQSPDGSIHGGNNYDKTVIGFAEFPANTRIRPNEDKADFRDVIESKASYVHWKDLDGGVND